MFLQKIKEFILKKNVNKKWAATKHSIADGLIQKVGVLFDESSFQAKDGLIQELLHHGIQKEHIALLVFKSRIKKNESFDDPFFSYHDFLWRGTLESDAIQNFSRGPYDLLINYFETENAPLLFVSQATQAGFRVGFSSVNQRANDLIIHSTVANYLEFSTELFKYLKLLKKI